MIDRAALAGWRLYVLTDRRLAQGRSDEEIVRAAISGGADAIQFRDKAADTTAGCLARAVRLAALCREWQVPFIVNDRLDIALAADAEGVHVGQGDLPVATARRLLGVDPILGASVTTVEDTRRATADGADYLGAGPVFEARATKPDAAEPIGLRGLAAICAATRLPVIAIGGITLANAEACRQAGATGVAVISAVVAADDVALATRTLRARVA